MIIRCNLRCGSSIGRSNRVNCATWTFARSLAFDHHIALWSAPNYVRELSRCGSRVPRINPLIPVVIWKGSPRFACRIPECPLASKVFIENGPCVISIVKQKALRRVFPLAVVDGIVKVNPFPKEVPYRINPLQPVIDTRYLEY